MEGEQLELVDDFGRLVPLDMCDHVVVKMTADLDVSGEYTWTVVISDGVDGVPLEWASGDLTHGPSGWLSASLEIRYWLDRAMRRLRTF